MSNSVIVSSNLFTGYSKIFTLDSDNNATLLAFNHHTNFDLTTFPYEIKYEIFERIVLQLFRNGNTKKGFALLLNTSFDFMKLFYGKYIGRFDLRRTALINHLIGLFNFIEDIVSIVFAPDIKTTEELYLNLYCRNSRTNTIDPFREEWPLGALTQGILDDIGRPAVELTEHLGLKLVRTGPRYCDLVWLAGKEQDGIISVSKMQSPIVLLEVYTVSFGIEHTLYRQTTLFFHNVIKMLKLCLGQESAVYLVFPIEGFQSLLREV